MRLNKFLIIILSLTLLAVLYVYQQSKIINLAYQEQEKLALLEGLIDKGNNLQYSIKRKTSLVSLADIWQAGDFEWPRQRQLVSMYNSPVTKEDDKQIIKESENIFAYIFQLKSQAEATPVNSP